MSGYISLHIETNAGHFAGYIEHGGVSMPLTEDRFQILVEALAETALPADRILHDFMERNSASAEFRKHDIEKIKDALRNPTPGDFKNKNLIIRSLADATVEAEDKGTP